MLRRINGTASIVALCLAFGVTAFADHKHQNEAQEHGYEHGYRDGFHRGMDDRDHGNKFKPDVKDADQGYEKSMGDKDRYKNGYRSGFQAGYADAFNNRPGRFSQIYGPYNEGARGTADREDLSAEQGWSGSHVASDLGYRDGLMAGKPTITTTMRRGRRISTITRAPTMDTDPATATSRPTNSSIGTASRRATGTRTAAAGR